MTFDRNSCSGLDSHVRTLCNLYDTYNRREYVHPDPLEFLFDYPDLRDREIVALAAACLAYGNVRQILKTVSDLLTRLQRPFSFILNSSVERIRSELEGFRYRFTSGEDLALLLIGMKGIIERYGSLNSCFCAGFADYHENALPALGHFVKELAFYGQGRPATLLPLPERGSACKRLNLFLRWMVRCDRVDPGGWEGIPASKLVIPLDVHMMRICCKLGLTQRKQADAITALEVTNAFRLIEPEDPVKYDFVLSRLGIRKDLSPDKFFGPLSEEALV